MVQDVPLRLKEADLAFLTVTSTVKPSLTLVRHLARGGAAGRAGVPPPRFTVEENEFTAEPAQSCQGSKLA